MADRSFSLALCHLARGKAAYVSVTLPLRAAGDGAKAQVIFGKDFGQGPFQPLPWCFVVLRESTTSFDEAWAPALEKCSCLCIFCSEELKNNNNNNSNRLNGMPRARHELFMFQARVDFCSECIGLSNLWANSCLCDAMVIKFYFSA